ncbi:MAG: hypothetical protein HXY38_01145 [Chloroflexi bacterium]|nr:hypothetical protein [Chloroflexota bacterium]
MKRYTFVLVVTGLILSACMPALPQLGNTPTPYSEADLQATAAILSQQTLQALADSQPTASALPTETPVIVTPSQTPTQPTPTETGVPALLTLTATLLAGAPTAGTESALTGTLDASATSGTAAANSVNPSVTAGTPHPLFYGTLPPNLPYGTVEFFNKSHVDVYISLRCVTKDGYVTILEYPVKKNFRVSAPAGKYTYVAWVGGRQFDGSFSMDKDGYITITFFTNRINVKKSN